MRWFVLLASLVAGFAPADELPAAVRGFSGQVAGIVKGRTDRGVRFEVRHVREVWRNNEAREPKALEGRVVEIRPGRVKGDDGRWRLNELHVRFLRKLKVGEDYRIELRHREGSWLEILELTAEQREWARREGDGKEHDGKEGDGREHDGKEHDGREHDGREHDGREHDGKEGDGHEGDRREPDGPGWRGFRGLVRGIVRGRKERGIRLEIRGVVKVWPRNEAREPESLVGRTVDVFPRWRKGDDGKWRPIEDDVRFLRGLEEGREIEVEIVNDEGEAFHILELPGRDGDRR